jgi:transaldolase
LLGELEADAGNLDRVLSPDNESENIAKLIENEAQFRFSNNEDAMATEKLSEGIRNFVKDQINLETYLSSKKG